MNISRWIIAVAAALLLSVSPAWSPQASAASQPASSTSFHFVFAADSRDNYTVLPDLSHKMVTLSPVFGFFGGDLCGTFSVNCINNTWKPAMDGNDADGMLARTFVMRGNHDSTALSNWQNLWNFQVMAVAVGATHYSALAADATYSFDFGNSHFSVVDLPGGGASSWASAQISWLDADLTAAEDRGVTHEFLFAHGPMYGVTAEHGSEEPSATLKAVLNRHPISAGFHGHEHVTQFTLVTPSIETGINDYREFTMGRAGAPPHTIIKPTDWQADENAFADVAVDGNDFTVTVYSQSGSALWSGTFADTPFHRFADVPVPGQEWMEPWINAFYRAGISSGCGSNPLIYCPEANVTRAELAVFLLRARHGAAYKPPAKSHFFSDMPVPGKEWMEAWVDEYHREGLTTGCGGGKFCPESNVTRAEMAVFVLRATRRASYQPPASTGVFSDVPVAGKEWMQPWIEEYYHEGITSGCGGTLYCPDNNVTRAEMAVFLDRAYRLYAP